MDDNMNDNMNNMDNTENENESVDQSFGSSEYYKKLYDDMPEDVAEMLIGTHPLMRKEVSDELTHSIKIRSARKKNLRAVSDEDSAGEEKEEATEHTDNQEEYETVSASKDPVEDEYDDVPEEDMGEYVGDITNFTKGLVTPSSKKQRAEAIEKTVSEEPKSEDDITAEQIAKMLGGVDVEPVDESEMEQFEEDDYEERPRHKVKKEERTERPERPRKKRRSIDEKELEISNIEKQANLNELFREDDDYYDEKHSGFSVARIVAIIAAVVVLAFFIYKVASLSGQVTKLNEQIETYKTMETEYEQMKLDNLSLTEQVESLKDQLGGNTSGEGTNGENTENTQNTENNGTTSNNNSGSVQANTNTGSKTYTVQEGDTFWGIATKMYGNGSYYERILKANGLTENDKIKVGMTLTIPAA